jgi:hypothetical protein
LFWQYVGKNRQNRRWNVLLEHSDVAVVQEDDEADAPVLDLIAGNFGSSSFSSVPEDTKTNNELSFFADFGNNFQVETAAAPTTKEFAVFDDAAFDQNFDQFSSGMTKSSA